MGWTSSGRYYVRLFYSVGVYDVYSFCRTSVVAENLLKLQSSKTLWSLIIQRNMALFWDLFAFLCHELKR